ncbi:YgiQ family radical SAM protein [Ruminococcus sp.]|uniref:YgiQ family radical SAM protein n=1 Tax=Ruminococcus sp. TaxID=41978 RepID=UPI0025CFEE2E|nr:YgiQ family radical SAM protein [Ruminococcus sp.]MBD9051387.1 YgiQ family radical SAM protein [Ruminococcus sp.]
MAFLPMNIKEVKARGWDEVDFVYVMGDSYVDHPSFGAAIITRVLEDCGYRVAVLSQPDWKNDADFLQFGKPRLGFFVTAGNIDSMVAHYTVAKRKRSDDAYTAGGKNGKRPDRAVTVYSNIIRRLYPDSVIIIGGLEASLRRFAHYDYWKNTVMPSVLFDSKADIISYGMGELQTIEMAKRLSEGYPVEALYDIRGICYAVKTSDYVPKTVVELPSYERVCESKKDYAIAARKELEEADAVRGKTLIQRYGNFILIQNPPMQPLDTKQLDYVYSLPYERWYPQCYEKLGGVPGIQEVLFSITHNRGCFGACNFCSLAFHQGRAVTVRSKQSVIDEAKSFLNDKRFKGYISDVGGPTANFRLPSCEKQKKAGLCKSRKCLAPTPCPNMQVSHTEYLDILRELRKLDGIKKVFIRSGIRFDYLMEDQSDEFFEELVKYHISGQLRVAPEHCSAAVLDRMGKPHIETYKKFCDKFYKLTGRMSKDQYIVPYLMSSHPGSTLKDAVELALFCKRENIHPKQVQDFYPTPGTISTCMFYTGIDPYTMKEVYVPKTEEEKSMQRALLQYFIPENKQKVIKALIKAGRKDLIGYDSKCLVQPMSIQGNKSNGKNNGKKQSYGSGKNNSYSRNAKPNKDKFAKYRRKKK